MLKIRIKDFQSIGDISFDVTGFTVIVGKNNLGKSAIIRAIDAALNNRTGSEFIRWGKTKSEVSIKKDALEIEWAKGDTATYKVNGKSFSKLNRAVPQPITDAGIRKIEIGEQKLNPLIAHQFEELFLLDKPGSVITEVLSVIYNLNILSDADDLCLKELRSNKSILKTRESDLVSLQEHIEKYKEIETVKRDIEEIKALDKKTETLKSEITSINTYVDTLQRLSKNISIFKSASDTKIPTTVKIENDISEYGWIKQVTLTFKDLLVSVKNLNVASKVEVPEYASTQSVIDQVQEVSKFSETFNSSVKIINRLKASLDSLSLYDFSLVSLEEQISSLDHVKKITEEFLSSVKVVKDLKAEIEKTNSNLSTVQQEFSQYKACPLCLKPL